MFPSTKVQIRIFGVSSLLMIAAATSAFGFIGNCGSSRQMSLTTSQLLDRLKQSRDRFLKNGSFVDVFPTLYYSTTSALVSETKSMEPEDARLVNEQIKLFFYAFEANRLAFESKGLTAVESHWKTYYREAVRLGKKKDATTFEVIMLILDGVDAHLEDLPRSIRYQTSMHPDSAERLKVLYFGFDNLFPAIVRSFDKDVAEGFGKRGITMLPFSLQNVGASYVVHSRQRAWELSSKNQKLRTKKPQPFLCYDK